MYIMSADVGTTTLKACLFKVDPLFELIAEAEAGYSLYSMPGGGMEQDHDEWWQALCRATKTLIDKSGVPAENIAGFSICAQMLGLVLVDRDGIPVRRPMNYLDKRAEKQWKKGICGAPRLFGYNLWRAGSALMIAKAAPLDIKDPIWRYLWVKENEPENYSRVYKWIDVKDYLNARCTGNIVATEDSAFGTMIYENAKGKKNFSSRLLKTFGVQESHMPKVIPSTDVVGYLSPKAAEEMGLAAGTPVFGGGGDSSCIPLGSGYTGTGDTHVYIGTSGWVSTVSEKRPTDPISMIASIYGSEEGKFNYHAEMNAAGKCYEWVRDHVALDSINIYADGPGGSGSCRDIKIYDRLSQAAMQAEVGSGGLIFTPWLTGERCPISSPEPCGMFFNLSLRTDKSAIIRSVLEGICYHINWMMEMHEKILPTSPTLRFVGGGSLSPVTCQMLADITGKQVETIPWPQNAGAVGAAVISAVGLGIIPDFSSVKDYIPVDRVYIPDPKAHELYSGYFRIYKKLYPANRKLFEKLHKIRGCDHERL